MDGGGKHQGTNSLVLYEQGVLLNAFYFNFPHLNTHFCTWKNTLVTFVFESAKKDNDFFFSLAWFGVM